MIIFRNRDIISGEEIAECYNNGVNENSKNRLLNLKKLRRINNIYYVWDYNKEFKKLIFSYKYKRKIKLSKLIGEVIREEIFYVLQKEKIDVIISVPINKKRKNERGFNQVDEILNVLKLKYDKIERIKNTEKMYKLLDEKMREKNIEGSFRINKNLDLKNKNILIVDDIITTGSTLKEIKNSILKDFSEIEKQKINFFVFCLAAATEIKKNKGEI